MQYEGSNNIESCCNNGSGFGLFSIPAEQFTALATLIGFLLANDLDIDEQNSLGNFLIAIGQILVTIASQKALIEDRLGK